jgi:DNA (cytosine-5)-methyltransferase 1
VSISERKSITKLTAATVQNKAFEEGKPKVYGIIGGPPCPDFSVGGKNRGNAGKHGRLTKTFVDMICALKPTFFLMENVPGLLRVKKHREFLDGIVSRLENDNGYSVDFRLVNALELGVPQDRDRLFVIGIRRHLASKVLGRKISAGCRNWFPWPKCEYAGAKKKYAWPTTIPFGKDPSRPLDIPLELTVYPLLTGERSPESLPNGKEFFTPHSPKFMTCEEGEVSNKSFKRLHRYGNNEVHLHPWHARRLSVREALRIQTVPDEYVLPKGFPLSAKFKMICNGVPVLMARRIAESIDTMLSQLPNPSQGSGPR